MNNTNEFLINWFAFGLEKACEMDQRNEIKKLIKEKNERN